jgi:cell division protein ZapA (FtsZ GTPase activity inhibitor)
MDLHFATEKVASLKDAGLRYLVIVAGILTALCLNQWIETRRQADQGAEALSSIEAELRRNQDTLAKVMQQQQVVLDKLQAVQERLGKGSFAVPDLQARARAVLKEELLEGTTDLNLAALQRSAWDAVVANQSLQYVPKERAVVLARAYAAIGEISSVARQSALAPSTFDNLITLDMYDRGESADALRFARAVRQHALLVKVVHSSYQALQSAIQQALPAAAPAASAAQP